MKTSVHQTLRTSIILAMLLAGIAPGTAAAATYYVATSGNDSNAGSITQPFRTIRKGISVLSAGDTLRVRGGTYTERIDSNQFAIPSGTSWDNAVTIAVYPGEMVVIQAGSLPGVVNLAHSYIRYVIFDGFVFDGRNVGGFGTSVVSLWGGVNHVRFVNTEVKNSPSHGVTIYWGNGASSDYNEFRNCSVHDNGQTGDLDHGFYINGSHNLVEGCRIYNNRAYGVQIYSGYSGLPANGNVIRGNRLYGNGITSNNGGGIVTGSGSGTLVYNNLIYENKDGVVVCCGYTAPANQKILNNTVTNNHRFGVEVQQGTGHVVRNNILRLNASGDTRFLVNVTNSNNLTGDPLFVDAPARDFRLRSTSPAIDTGQALNEVQDDFDKTARPQGLAHDVGAFEYRAQTAQAPAAPLNLRIVQ